MLDSPSPLVAKYHKVTSTVGIVCCDAKYGPRFFYAMRRKSRRKNGVMLGGYGARGVGPSDDEAVFAVAEVTNATHDSDFEANKVSPAAIDCMTALCDEALHLAYQNPRIRECLRDLAGGVDPPRRADCPWTNWSLVLLALTLLPEGDALRPSPHQVEREDIVLGEEFARGEKEVVGGPFPTATIAHIPNLLRTTVNCIAAMKAERAGTAAKGVSVTGPENIGPEIPLTADEVTILVILGMRRGKRSPVADLLNCKVVVHGKECLVRDQDVAGRICNQLIEYGYADRLNPKSKKGVAITGPGLDRLASIGLAP